MKPLSLAFLFATSALMACQEETESINTNDVLRSTVEETILPNIDTLSRTASDVHSQAVDFCENPSLSALSALRFSWKGGKKMLKSIEALNFGPYNFSDIDISRTLDNWPERSEGIERVISSDNTIDSNLLQTLNSPDVSRGYPALGYLLHSSLEDELLVEHFSDQRRCDYLVAQAEFNQEIIASFQYAWSPSGDDFAAQVYDAGIGSAYFVSAEEGIAHLLKKMDENAMHIAEIKLAQPLSMARRDALEASYSQNSLSDIYTNLEALEALYKGSSTSISDYIYSIKPDTDANIRQAFDEIRHNLDTISVPLSQAITEQPEALTATIESFHKLSRIINEDASIFINVN